ncbi:MAG TPA: fused MFS/spermidine synthase [Fimbriimonadaceae bacterium]|nr:fused MFS/spermidine synthase [Fimbriimonadaceae bacterium]
MRLLFTLATFLGSFALFLLEPMVAKALLPSFGGSSLVWNVCLLFFQAALLAGYGYANVLTRRAEVRRATPIHWLVLGAAVALSITLFAPSGLWQVRPSPEGSPLKPLLITLILTTAAPFVVLAAGTPLIQRWFAHSDDEHAHDPYFLYAASNLGSFFGLIAYPTLIEPRLPLGAQRLFVCALLAGYCLLLVLASARLRSHVVSQTDEPTAQPLAPIANAMRAKWTLLSAGPSALLLAVTSDLTKNIAPIPLLWVLPLGLYLLTFVIVFSHRARKLEAEGNTPMWLRMALALALAFNAFLALASNVNILVGVPAALVGFFFVALACHLRLARLRPVAGHLTEYYLWVSTGGVLGGLFCAVVAPLVFRGLTELPVSLGFCVALYGFIQYDPKKPKLDFIISAGAIAAIACLWMFTKKNDIPAVYVVGILALIFLGVSPWPGRFAAVFLGYLVWFGFQDKNPKAFVMFASRNYYGFETVLFEQDPPRRRLVNGNITHGLQINEKEFFREPTTYYAKDGPLGEALLPTLDARPGAKIGAVGLGTGTEAAYGRPGMTIDFYELNPTVKYIAENPHFFTYVRDSQAKVNVILGDARLSLNTAPNGTYDAIILDAFSSDSIPVHLLTKEALQLYVSKMKPDGIILVHTSNRYLTLAKYVAATARSAGLQSDVAFDDRDADFVRWPTTWLCLARNRDRLREIDERPTQWEAYEPPAGTQGWTDDYSNVFGALKVLNKDAPAAR